jgi:hypothetical protein
MAGFYPIKCEVDGRSVRGEWTIKQGGCICVRAPGYGPALTVPLGTRRPPEYARVVLAIMARAYFRRQEAWRAHEEREAIRMGGRRRRRAPLMPA